MTVSHADLIAALEGRYDYYSARVVLKEVLTRAEVAEKATYGDPEVASIVQVLRSWGDRTDHVVEALTMAESVPGDSADSANVAATVEETQPEDHPANVLTDPETTQVGVTSEPVIEGSGAEHAEVDSGDSDSEDSSGDDKSSHSKKPKSKKGK
ncbi:MAG: hypothetical protein HUU55_19975 [Myxococcales bacterium]|nr:hypothetical protein [Myxococcales bacterium]